MSATRGLPSLTPRDLGFAMPPESVEHARTWTSWPAGDDLWQGELRAVRREFATFVATVARFEPVVVNVGDDAAERDARTHLSAAGAEVAAESLSDGYAADTDRSVTAGRVHLHRTQVHDVWCRDVGPLFVVDRSGHVAITDWRFDGWGGSYPSAIDDGLPGRIAATLRMRRFAMPWVLEGGGIEVDDDGTFLTTRSCLLDGIRNPGLDADGYRRVLRDGLGAEAIVWLPGGLVDDHTDGHVDTIVRVAGDGVALCTIADDDDADNAAAMHAVRSELSTATRADGRRYEVVDLPLPLDRSVRFGVRPPRSYANFCLVNGGVVVPTYDDPRDGLALVIVASAFPGREVVGSPCSSLITGGGAFHCVTQHQPKGPVAHG